MKRLKILLQSKAFFFFSLIFLVFYVLLFTKVITYSSLYKQDNNEFVGRVIAKRIDGDKLSLTIKAKEKIQVSYYFKTLKDKNYFEDNLKLGQTLEIKGSLSKPNKNTLPNTFNYYNYLYNKKIYWTLNADKIVMLDKKIPLIYNIKNYFISRVNGFKNINSYMYAFILGDSGHIDNDVYENFQNNGVTHLFAVSGMHIGLFILVIDKGLKKLHFKDNVISYCTILFFLFYLFLVGFSASVVRATMFYMLLFFNKKFKWNFKSMRLFYFLLFILLIINPFYVYDIGFIYSFTTSFGLMLFSKKITGNYFVKLFKTSSIAFLFSLPITIYFNYEFNLITILNNLIIVPIVSVILFPLSLLTFIFPFLEVFLSKGFYLLEIINNFLNYFSLNVVIGKISIVFLLLYYMLIFLGFKNKYYYLLLLIIILGAKYKFWLDSNSYIYYLDVGQGDASLIVTEHRKDLILIDSGGKIEYEKEEWQIRNTNFNLADSITKFMKSLGISKIDLFIATHGDKDHIGYALDLFKKVKLKKIMLNNNDYNGEEKKLLEFSHLQIKNNYKGKKILIQNLNRFITSNENDSSLVLYITISNKKILVMGDAPKEVELDIINKYKLKCSILKIGHHGSNTSSTKEFIDAINPKYSIISVGKNNRYGHPNKEVLENLESTIVYRTDLDGSIMFKIKKDKLYIGTCPP